MRNGNVTLFQLKYDAMLFCFPLTWQFPPMWNRSLFTRKKRSGIWPHQVKFRRKR